MCRVIGIAVVLTVVVVASASADNPDAPDSGSAPNPVPPDDDHTYEQRLDTWKTPEDVSAWIGARFEYDSARALQLSETQRRRTGRLPIMSPAEFFAAPTGVCVDLSRFAVESVRVVDPDRKAAYVMIEFEPVTVAGNILRRHWLASFRRDGKLWVFADSKRPGYVGGPYETLKEFADEYAVFRQRAIVDVRELDTFERRRRARDATGSRRATATR